MRGTFKQLLRYNIDNRKKKIQIHNTEQQAASTCHLTRLDATTYEKIATNY
jgi:hypothetical protein